MVSFVCRAGKAVAFHPVVLVCAGFRRVTVLDDQPSRGEVQSDTINVRSRSRLGTTGNSATTCRGDLAKRVISVTGPAGIPLLFPNWSLRRMPVGGMGLTFRIGDIHTTSPGSCILLIIGRTRKPNHDMIRNLIEGGKRDSRLAKPGST